MFENIGHGLAGSCNLGAAGEAGAAVEADAIGERNGRNWGVEAEADTSGKQQLKRTQTGSAS